MISINIGNIFERKSGKKIWYEISILEGIETARFEDLEKAIKYVRKHAFQIFQYPNLNSLHMRYYHLNGKIHYLLFKRNKEGEIVFFEETQFDFLRTHPHKRTKYRLRRAVNDKNYSFSDVFRVTINWHPFFSIWNSIILFFILVGSGLFLIYGLNHLSDNDSRFETLYKTFLLLAFFIGLISVSLIGILHFTTRFTLFQVSGDFKKINWRKWYLIRINQLIFSILFASISLSSTIILLEEVFKTNYEFRFVLIINLILWLANLISSIIMLLYSYNKRILMLRKYFTKSEVAMFKKWAKDPKSKEIWKQNPIFIFDDNFSNNLTRKAIDKTIEKLRWALPKHLKKMRKQELAIKKHLITNYNSYDKRGG